jgi:hypothetical protein
LPSVRRFTRLGSRFPPEIGDISRSPLAHSGHPHSASQKQLLIISFGSRLFYRHGSNQMMAVPIRTSPTLEVGAPELLFEGPILGTTWLEYRSYDITRDGKRFIASGKFSEPRRLEVVLNWFEELKPLRRKQIANDR